jgi:phosphatidyl-myo-inositol dimannoside synthase
MATLLISEIFPPKTGGSGRWFWELYRRLPREEFVIAAGLDPQQESLDKNYDVRLHRIPLSLSDWGVLSFDGGRGYLRALKEVLRIVRSERIKEIHCGRCLPEGWIGWLVKQWYGIPYVCYAHGEDVNLLSLDDNPSGLFSSRQLRWMMQRVLQDAKFVIANSRNTELMLRRGWNLPVERIRLLYPGVDTQRFIPALKNEAVRATLGWEERRVVLTVGRLETRKGHDYMILALQAIRKVIPNILYAIVGDGDRRSFLETLVQREGLKEHVQFLGELDDDQLISCYQQCDLFVLPNREVNDSIEGFGIVLLEAQSCGKPVVAGASGGTSEAMHIPETGRVIPCDESGNLAAVVIELLMDSSLRARMGKAGRRWVVEHFDWALLSRRAGQLFRSPTIPNASEQCAQPS